MPWNSPRPWTVRSEDGVVVPMPTLPPLVILIRSVGATFVEVPLVANSKSAVYPVPPVPIEEMTAAGIKPLPSWKAICPNFPSDNEEFEKLDDFEKAIGKMQVKI